MLSNAALVEAILKYEGSDRKNPPPDGDTNTCVYNDGNGGRCIVGQVMFDLGYGCDPAAPQHQQPIYMWEGLISQDQNTVLLYMQAEADEYATWGVVISNHIDMLTELAAA